MNRVALIMLAVVLAGALLRLPDLAVRPMHTDEAVHAVKFGTLLESGDYRYDPYEYHGPTLNYLTFLPAWLTGTHTYAALQEWHLRAVPAACGTLLLALFVVFDPHRTRWSLWAAVFTAVSPAMVFYSRYYIQEMLLVFFTLGFAAGIYRYMQTRTWGWAACTGVAAGLMFATKETSVIAFGVTSAACIAVWFMRRQRGVKTALPGSVHWFIAGGAAAVVIIAFFSSFGRNPRGVLDAFGTFAVYVERAGTTGRHLHPWYYYLHLLGWSHGADGRLWTEGGILLFAVAGFVRAWKERLTPDDPAVVFRIATAIATILMLIIISVMPYKTPWVVLTALLGLIIMAGSGVDAFLSGNDRMRIVRVALLAGIVAHLGWEAWNASFVYADRPGNPYVYAHPTGDVVEIGKAVTALAAVSPAPINVVVCYQDGDYWPMPWYLRKVAHTGWWSSVPDTLPSAGVALVSPELEPALTKALYERAAPGERPLYVPLFSRPAFVRPGREIRVYTTLALRELGERAGEMISAPTVHKYAHHAMATLFEVFIADEDPAFAAGAAQAAFDEIDRLEQELSRYRPNSDIARINNLPPGGETRVSADTFACLQLAHQYWQATNGAFDITMGALMDAWVAPDKSLRNPNAAEIEEAVRRSGMQLLSLDESTFLVGVGEHVPKIDPGAIGKGYAVDVCIELLQDWGVGAALVHGGTSSAAGYGHAWPVTASSFAEPHRVLRKVALDGIALSGSGVKKGRHIIDTRTHKPVAGRHAAWVCVPSAAESDALSTAFMVMPVAEIAAFCDARSGIRAIVIDDDGAPGERVFSYGWGSGDPGGG